MLNEHTSAAAMGALGLSDAAWDATPDEVQRAIVAYLGRGRKAVANSGPRPHAGATVAELEGFVDDAEEMQSVETLREVLRELMCRSTAKAGKLRERVEAALSKGNT